MCVQAVNFCILAPNDRLLSFSFTRSQPPFFPQPRFLQGMSFKVGERVQGNYKGVGIWYPGKIASIASGLGGALFTINYDDGDVESVPASRVQRPFSFKVGDVIEGNYQGCGSFYQGKIAAGPNDEGNYSIDYDDGDKEKNVNPSLIRIPKALQTYKVGESVEGNFQNFGVWYPGVVVKVYQLKLKSVFDVDYDDGDKYILLILISVVCCFNQRVVQRKGHAGRKTAEKSQ